MDDVRRIALRLPETSERESRGSLDWRVTDKGFVWERPLRKSDIEALGERVPAGPVFAAHTADEGVKLALIADNPRVFFTTRISTAIQQCCSNSTALASTSLPS